MADIAQITAKKVYRGTSREVTYVGSQMTDGLVYFNDSEFYRATPDGKTIELYNGRGRWVLTTGLKDVTIDNVDLIKGTDTPQYSGPQGARKSKSFLRWPTDATGAWTTYANHYGIDIPVASGTPIYAAHAGTIIVSGNGITDSSYGIEVAIANPNLDDKGFATHYGHLSKVAVTKGTVVKAGQLIAYSGNTGNSSGPHLHFELWTGVTSTSSWVWWSSPATLHKCLSASDPFWNQFWDMG